MNLFSIAVFFVRLTGFSFLVDAAIHLTYVPESLVAAGSTKGAFAGLQEFHVAMTIFRVMLFALIGAVFLAFSKPLSKAFTRNLNNSEPEPFADENTWPPAPKN